MKNMKANNTKINSISKKKKRKRRRCVLIVLTGPA